MVVLLAASLAYAHGPSLVHAPGSVHAHITKDVQALPASGLEQAFEDAAAEFGVPAPLLKALAFEATRFDPSVTSTWGGWTMFDLREGDEDPSLEHAGRLLEVDPNLMITDWRLSVRGAAAILADQARLANGGALPPVDDLLAWNDAVRAFSGRHEPFLQELYARYVYEVATLGAVADTPYGRVTLAPRRVDPAAWAAAFGAVAPPGTTDSSLAYQYVGACDENYSDYSRGAGDIDVVVIHTTQGSYSGAISWFTNCSASVSAHYTIRSSDGQITQSVREEDVAWHAGNWDYNTRSVGIEHEGWVDEPDRWYTDAMYASSAELVVDIANRQGVPLDRSHIIGHVEVPGATHTDPGTGWDWDFYMGLIGGETGVVGGDITGVVADQDIYNGARLVGAEVWIAETGQRTTVASDGYYRFEDVPFGAYTIHAFHPGYAEGTCAKTTSSSTDWCSIALYPDDGAGEDTDLDTGAPPVDGNPDAALPGDTFRIRPLASGCATAGAPAWLALIGLAGLFGRRRRP